MTDRPPTQSADDRSVSDVPTVRAFPSLPCEPAGESDYAEDSCHYCRQHDEIVCPTCHRHPIESEHSVAPGDPFTCPVHGVFASMGNP